MPLRGAVSLIAIARRAPGQPRRVYLNMWYDARHLTPLMTATSQTAHLTAKSRGPEGRLRFFRTRPGFAAALGRPFSKLWHWNAVAAALPRPGDLLL